MRCPHAILPGHRAGLRGRSTLPTVGMLLFAALLPGCDQASTGGALDLEALPTLMAEADMRIGSVDDPEAGFSRVTGVDVDGDGQIYVFEGADMQIRVYGPDGRLLRRIGRRGEGPGEFQRVARFGVVGDTVWTFDYAGERITIFDRDGTVLSTGRADSRGIPLWNRCFGYVMPWTMRPDGLFTSLFGRVACNPNTPAPEVGPADSVPVPRLLFDATGAIVDTIGDDGGPPPRMARPPEPSSEQGFRVIEVGGRPYVVPQRPTDLPRWIRLHDGRIVLTVPLPTSRNAAFTVTRIGLYADTVYSRRFRYEPGRYTPSELDALAAEAASGGPFGGGGAPADPAVEPRLRAEMDFPEFRPATQSVQVDRDGRLWILRDEPEGPTSRFALLDAQGLPLGELELPGQPQLMWSRADALWVVETDEFDVPWLVLYRIEGL